MDYSLSTLLLDALDFVLIFIPIVLPFVLGYLLIKLWIDYTAEKFQSEQESVLLEIIPPKEISKTPAAMELFLTSIHWTGGETTWIKKYIAGSRRPSFSLEMVSLGGAVHFYIYTREGFKDLIESQMYAQYPGVEVVEVEDYAQKFQWIEGQTDFFGMEYKLDKPDPYPIKTYVDYGLDSPVKEEEKTDPITPVLETLATLGPGEQMWIQIIIKSHKKEDKVAGSWFKKTDAWVDSAKDEIMKIRKESLQEVQKGENKEQVNIQTEGQKRTIAALERSVSKISYDVGYRVMYLAEKDNFVGTRIPAMLNSVKQYNSAELNGFKYSHSTSFDYPWEDFMNIKLNKIKKDMLQSYKDRTYFNSFTPGFFKSKERKPFVLNVEELATIWHIPGQVAQTPSLGRVDSRKATPPSNLPI